MPISMASWKVNRGLQDNEQLDFSRPRWTSKRGGEDLCAAFVAKVRNRDIEPERCYPVGREVGCLRLWKYG